MSLIELIGVKKLYSMGESEVKALNGVDLSIQQGEFLSIVGPSGSGKSTLLNMIGCIDTPTSGKVLLEGKDISSLGDRELTRTRLRKIGFVFQQFYLLPTLTTLENVELPMKEARVPHAQRRARAEELLSHVSLSNRAGHYPNQLSGGEQQRVAIARALANRPHLILADEPTGEVDSQTTDRIVSLLRDLHSEQGITVIIVTHDLKIADSTDRLVSLNDGRIESDVSHVRTDRGPEPVQSLVEHHKDGPEMITGKDGGGPDMVTGRDENETNRGQD